MAVELGELVLDPDRAVHVDVGPAEPGELAPAEAGVGGQEDERLPPRASGLSQGGDLLGGGGPPRKRGQVASSGRKSRAYRETNVASLSILGAAASAWPPSPR